MKSALIVGTCAALLLAGCGDDPAPETGPATDEVVVKEKEGRIDGELEITPAHETEDGTTASDPDESPPA